jgi:thiol-disulfide isomerase/thioredoxin
MALEMAGLKRRALLAGAGTVLAALAARKFAARDAAAQGTPQPPAPPGVEMRPLSDIVLARPPASLPAVSFATLDGARKTLADYAGRKVILNFWATWCVPCVAELPELDRLAAGGQFTVLAVSADRGGAAVVKPFVASHGIAHATILLDPGSDAAHALLVAGFPTTLLIGADGKLRGTLEGPAAWGDAAPALDKLLGA